MFRHNLLLFYRSFKRFKDTFFINLAGLSTGMACALLICLWVNDELDFDKFHEKGAQLFQVMVNQKLNSGTVTTVHTSGILAETLASEMPEVEHAVGVQYSFSDQNTLSVGENHIKAVGLYAGKDYFSMFSYGLLQGDEGHVLQNNNSIVISQDLSMRLFGTTKNVVGNTVEFQHERQFMVSGVFKGTPSNSSLQFDFVLSIDLIKEKYPHIFYWENNWPYTYVMLKKGTDIHAFNEKIAGLIKKNSKDKSRTLFLRPYADMHLYDKYENGEQAGGRIEYVRLFTTIAIFILVIACINFMNLSTAKASRRIKEIGIKKAIGAQRQSLVFQFWSESMLMAFLSLAAAILLVVLLLPKFNEITGKQLSMVLSTRVVLVFFSIALLVGLIAGSYPALYLSGFNPAIVLKGKLRDSVGELWARKGLVIFQFTLSVILTVAVLVVYKQIELIQEKNLGYNRDNIVYFEKEGRAENNLETLLMEIRNIPGVTGASSIAGSIVGSSFKTQDVQWTGKRPDNEVAFEYRDINYDLIEMLGVVMKEGRSFSRSFPSDSAKIILNETAIKVMGIQDPVGKVVRLWGTDMEILGVTKDFHFESLHDNVKPLLFRLAPLNTGTLMVKMKAGKEKETIEKLQQLYLAYNPGFSLRYRFLDKDYQAQYDAERRVSVLSGYFAALAILISCLGLFGLASFTAERRFKEIGIRKALGATKFSIVYILSVDFTKMVLIAILIAIPISYVIARYWLESFVVRIELQPWYFLGAGIIALLMAWLTVGMQAVKAASINPLQCLRSE